MKIILRIISGFIIGLVFLIPLSFLMSKTFPQLNTNYSKQFNFDNYNKIAENHNILQVENLIGTPIFITEENSGEDKFYWYSTDKKNPLMEYDKIVIHFKNNLVYKKIRVLDSD